MRLVLIVIITFLANHTFGQSDVYSEWYLKTNDSLDLFIKELGHGVDTVIVVHGGFGANHEYMLESIEGLEEKFHFVFYDQRGSLLSPVPENKLTFQKNVDDLHTLITELQINDVKILCHSMGTLVGMEYLKQHPDNVQIITLIGALPTKSDSISSIFDQRYEEQLAFLKNRHDVRILSEPYENKIGPKSSQVDYYNYNSQLTDREQTELWRIQFASVNIYRMKNWNRIKGGRSYYKGIAAEMANSVNWTYDYRSLLNSLEKATIIMGDFDFIDFNGEKHLSALKNYTNVNIEIIEKSGHNIWTDNPYDFKVALEKSLTTKIRTQ